MDLRTKRLVSHINLGNIKKKYANKHVLIFGAGIIFLLAVVGYTSYVLYNDIDAGYTLETPPLDKLSKQVVFQAPVFGSVSLAEFFIFTIKGLSILLILLEFIVILKGDNTGRIIVSLYGLLLLALGSGKVGLREVYFILFTTLVLLYLHPITRGWRQILKGYIPSIKVKGSLTITGFTIILYYILPIALSVGAASLIVSLSEAIGSRELSVPPPLPNIWNVFMQSRLAILAVSLIVIGIFSWFIREFGETIIYLLLITPEEALRRVKSIINRDIMELKMDKAWHQSIPIGLFVSLASIFAYGYIIIVSDEIDKVFQQWFGSSPWYIPEALGFGVLIFAWGLVRREFRRMLTLKGNIGLSVKSLILLIGLLALIIYFWHQGRTTLDPLYYALGLKEPTSKGDIIRNLGLWPVNFYNRLESMFKSFESTARFVVRFLWG
ncbi:MAG: hypothetical protein GSR79_01455 [Desulfurococcales archaeon]|nr:hypothetical protein [Desulfurococcales archaeon]